jgi:hypothetical protein
MGNLSSLGQQIEALMPKSLDDIIRKNRDLAQLRQTTDEEILELYHEITPGRPKDIMDEWTLITLDAYTSNFRQVMLIGDVRRSGIQRITSVVQQIDMDRQFLITKSGSLYQLGTPKIGPPDEHQLMCICAGFHEWGIGNFIGAPSFFY